MDLLNEFFQVPAPPTMPPPMMLPPRFGTPPNPPELVKKLEKEVQKTPRKPRKKVPIKRKIGYITNNERLMQDIEAGQVKRVVKGIKVEVKKDKGTNEKAQKATVELKNEKSEKQCQTDEIPHVVIDLHPYIVIDLHIS